MKKILLIVLLAVLVGSSFAIYMFMDINDSVKSVIATPNTGVYAFQAGVFSVYENAQKVANQFEDSYIYQDDDKYRVFLAIYQDQEIVDHMSKYYKENNIDVYLKKINANNEFLDQLNKYEALLKETTDKNTYISANKSILGVFAKTV